MEVPMSALSILDKMRGVPSGAVSFLVDPCCANTEACGKIDRKAAARLGSTSVNVGVGMSKPAKWLGQCSQIARKSSRRSRARFKMKVTNHQVQVFSPYREEVVASHVRDVSVQVRSRPRSSCG